MTKKSDLVWRLIWLGGLLWCLNWAEVHRHPAAWWVVLFSCLVQVGFVLWTSIQLDNDQVYNKQVKREEPIR